MLGRPGPAVVVSGLEVLAGLRAASSRMRCGGRVSVRFGSTAGGRPCFRDADDGGSAVSVFASFFLEGYGVGKLHPHPIGKFLRACTDMAESDYMLL